ncbi:MAG: alanine--tRNA ligase [Sphingomonadaceae bacterium]
MTGDEIRKAFLDFFASKGHLVMPSSSLVPRDDPTVLLTTAGMQQMIPYMVGKQAPPHPRLTSCQKCFRTTDIDSVGNPRNLTFFEMLGNFSIGDYFKKEAIAFAWEFSLDWLKLPKDKIYVTVHPTDDEAKGYWLEVGIPEERISYLEDNFWGPPGDSGPCGPDSELFIDMGPEMGCGRPECAPGCDCNRYLEYWNLVFMQYFQDVDGTRTPLPRKNIDTGLGLERMAAIKQGHRTVYETDLFRPILQAAESLSRRQYGSDDRTDFSLRVIADHGRAMTFLTGDGVLPSNEGRGYVLRRVIRRAVRHGRLLGVEGPFLSSVVDVVVNHMARAYPELAERHQFIRRVVSQEEERFNRTLQTGLGLLDRWIAEAKEQQLPALPGDLMFRLYDTYGFPRELSAEIAREAGLGVDEKGFQAAMERQRQLSRAAAKFGRVLEVRDAAGAVDEVEETRFLGYQLTETEGQIVALLEAGKWQPRLDSGTAGIVILDRTPFYAESGGQVGDTGLIVTADGRFEVHDTQRDEGGRILHIGTVVEGFLEVSSTAKASIDIERRLDTARHHTLTHLLHKALRDRLGTHVAQAGSLVAPEVARFDFTHDAALAPEDLRAVEAEINAKILANIPVEITDRTLEEAKAAGAMALFTEKYAELVRTVGIGDYSLELCGGTHVSNTGVLGVAHILTEGSVGAGVRRIEAVAGRPALRAIRSRIDALEAVGAEVGTVADMALERVRATVEELNAARKEVSRLRSRLARVEADSLLAKAVRLNGAGVIASAVEAESMDAMREMVDWLRPKLGAGVIVLGAVFNDRPNFVASVSKELISPRLDAVKLVRQVAAQTGGGGGGRPEMAQAGGKDPQQLRSALDSVPRLVQEALRD